VIQIGTRRKSPVFGQFSQFAGRIVIAAAGGCAVPEQTPLSL
jgi:hypothetical protein